MAFNTAGRTGFLQGQIRIAQAQALFLYRILPLDFLVTPDALPVKGIFEIFNICDCCRRVFFFGSFRQIVTF